MDALLYVHRRTHEHDNDGLVTEADPGTQLRHTLPDKGSTEGSGVFGVMLNVGRNSLGAGLGHARMGLRSLVLLAAAREECRYAG